MRKDSEPIIGTGVLSGFPAVSENVTFLGGIGARSGLKFFFPIAAIH